MLLRITPFPFRPQLPPPEDQGEGVGVIHPHQKNSTQTRGVGCPPRHRGGVVWKTRRLSSLLLLPLSAPPLITRTHPHPWRPQWGGYPPLSVFTSSTSVNSPTDKGMAPNAMQFGACLACLLKQLWDANPSNGLVWLYKWDILDAFQRCNLCPSDVSKFSYLVPPLMVDPYVLLCIDLMLPMGWVNSLDFFCTASDTVANNDNGYAMDPISTFVVYPPPPPHGWGIEDRQWRDSLSQPSPIRGRIYGRPPLCRPGRTLLLQMELLPRGTKIKPVMIRLSQQRHNYLT